jgi:hypothetical protein
MIPRMRAAAAAVVVCGAVGLGLGGEVGKMVVKAACQRDKPGRQT